MTERNHAIERELINPENRYLCWRQLPDGTYIALTRLAFTVGLCIGVQQYTPYTRRYCFESLALALEEYGQMNTGEDVPSGWIARRPETAEDKAAKSKPNYDPSVFWPKRDK